MYSQAIAGAEGDATLFGNRSAAYLAAGLYQDAILDARKATALAPAWAKGFYRCALTVSCSCVACQWGLADVLPWLAGATAVVHETPFEAQRTIRKSWEQHWPSVLSAGIANDNV